MNLIRVDVRKEVERLALQGARTHQPHILCKQRAATSRGLQAQQDARLQHWGGQQGQETRLTAEVVNAGAAGVFEAPVFRVDEYQLRVLPMQTEVFSRLTVLSTASWLIACGITQRWL